MFSHSHIAYYDFKKQYIKTIFFEKQTNFINNRFQFQIKLFFIIVRYISKKIHFIANNRI